MKTLCNLLVVSLCVSALPSCGDNAVAVGPTPLPPEVIPTPEPPKPEPPVIELVSIEILVEKTKIFPGHSMQAKAKAKYEDGTEKDITIGAAWSSDNMIVATTSNVGLISGHQIEGTATIIADFEGKRGTVLITVTRSVSWGDLPSISPQAKNYIIKSNFQNPDFGNGATTRWVRMPIPVYADPYWNRQNLADALNIWERAANSKLSFRIVETREEASTYGIVFNNPPRRPLPDRRCDAVFIDQVVNNVLLRVTDEARTVSGCYDWSRVEIARATGFAIGLDYTHEDSPDVMNPKRPVWNVSPLLSESVTWLYSVEPGMRPE